MDTSFRVDVRGEMKYYCSKDKERYKTKEDLIKRCAACSIFYCKAKQAFLKDIEDVKKW